MFIRFMTKVCAGFLIQISGAVLVAAKIFLVQTKYDGRNKKPFRTFLFSGFQLKRDVESWGFKEKTVLIW